MDAYNTLRDVLEELATGPACLLDLDHTFNSDGDGAEILRDWKTTAAAKLKDMKTFSELYTARAN